MRTHTPCPLPSPGSTLLRTKAFTLPFGPGPCDMSMPSCLPRCSPRLHRLGSYWSVQCPRARMEQEHADSEAVRAAPPRHGLGRTWNNPSLTANPPRGPWGKGTQGEQSQAEPHCLTGWGWPWAPSRAPMTLAGAERASVLNVPFWAQS